MIDFRVQRSWARDGFDIWLIERSPQGTRIAAPIELNMLPLTEGWTLPTPTLSVDGFFGRDVITAMKAGFAGLDWLDKEQLDIASKVQKAMQGHIDDLRMVIDRTLK